MASVADLHHISLGGHGRLSGGRSSSLDVDNNARRLGDCGVADIFHHQRESRTGRCGHGAGACPASADNRRHTGEFVFHLDKRSADFGKARCHSLGDFGGRGDGISCEESASGSKCPFCAGGISIVEFSFSGQYSISTFFGSKGFSSTQEIAWSGQIIWHMPQSCLPYTF